MRFNQNKPETILVTGGAGYIFSAFLNKMVVKYPEWQFINFDALYPASLPENISPSVQQAPNYIFVHGKLQNELQVLELLRKYTPSVIIHAAAKSNVDESYMEPISYLHDNVIGTATLLDAVNRVGQSPLFLHVSTDEVYSHSVGETPNSELSLLRPSNPYSSSKAAAEMCVMAYMQSYKLRVITVRPNNVYGPRHQYKLIPKFISLLRAGQKLPIHGDGSARRSFLYIDDMVNAFELVLLKGQVGEIYNIASRSEASVLDIAKKLIQMVRKTDKWEDYVTFARDRPFNDQRYLISDTKLQALGFRQTMELEDGLHQILNMQ